LGDGCDAWSTAGIASIRDGWAGTKATGSHMSTPLYLAVLAETLALAGKIDEGLAALDDALAQADVSGARGWDAEIHRLRGELTARLPYPDPAKTEDAFRTALAIAREQGRLGEARDLLAPVYDSFAEGFDTADLKDAKALLKDLAA